MDLKKQVKQLTKKPKLSKDDIYHFDGDIARNTYHQADILFMPSDKRRRYILTVVDQSYPRYVGAKELVNKTPSNVIKAFEHIYKNSTKLDFPEVLTTDNGKEFNNKQFRDFLEKNGVKHKVALTNRHRQVAIVEAFNGILAKRLFDHMLIKELKTKKTSKEWVQYLQKEVDKINQYREKRYDRMKKKPEKEKSEKTYNLFPIGTKVRYLLDYPVDFSGKRIGSKFRATDIRWSPKIHEIDNIVLHEGKPPLYQLKGVKNVLYTTSQLQKV